MRIGFIIPTDLESENLAPESSHITCAGYGAGKASACSAAAELIFEKNCDTILIWGLGGALSPALSPGDVLIGTHVAYKDFNIHPLCNSTGVGFVPNFAEDLWHPLDEKLCDDLYKAVRQVFPESNVLRGNICTGDQFVLHQSMSQYNRIEQKALAVDMESAAVAQFCFNLKRDVRFGVIRVISDSADSNADMDFTEFLQKFAQMNRALPTLKRVLENMDPKCCNAPPETEEDVWKILKDKDCFDKHCHDLYDTLHSSGNAHNITKIAGIEARGCFFAHKLAQMLNVPFVPVRRNKTTSSLEIRSGSVSGQDNILLVDDLIRSGATACEAAQKVRSAGAICTQILVLNNIDPQDNADCLAQCALQCISCHKTP